MMNNSALKLLEMCVNKLIFKGHQFPHRAHIYKVYCYWIENGIENTLTSQIKITYLRGSSNFNDGNWINHHVTEFQYLINKGQGYLHLGL